MTGGTANASEALEGPPEALRPAVARGNALWWSNWLPWCCTGEMRRNLEITPVLVCGP